MKKHTISLSKIISTLVFCFLLSNVTIAKNNSNTLLHALIDQNEATVSAVMKAQSWDDQQRVVVVSKASVDGIAWENQLILTAGSRLSGMATDTQGNLYLAGHFQDSLVIGKRLVEGSQGRHFFLLSLDAQGDFRFINTWQSSTIDHLSGLQLNEFGEIWIAGFLNLHREKSSASAGSTFWMRFDDLGQVDRVVTLQNTESQKQGQQSPVAPKSEDWVHMREGQMLDSLLSVRGMRILQPGDAPSYIDEDPDPNPDPDPDPDMPPPPPPT